MNAFFLLGFSCISLLALGCSAGAEKGASVDPAITDEVQTNQTVILETTTADPDPNACHVGDACSTSTTQRYTQVTTNWTLSCTRTYESTTFCTGKLVQVGASCECRVADSNTDCSTSTRLVSAEGRGCNSK